MHYKKLYLGNGQTRDEHRVVMEQHLGRRLRRHEVVHHKDENKSNNDLSNLKVMPLSDHSRMHRTGAPVTQEFRDKMRAIGIATAPNRKLEAWQVKEIRAAYRDGVSVGNLIILYNVAKRTVYDIVSRITWKQI